ncbi:MAG: flavin reductase [Kiritimatiellae bacterium]|nr:flavin reductase [Kiritimatiellia bacterium]
MDISKDILYIGVNDHSIDLFEGQYDVPNGMAYNSYAILDGKTAVMDTVDARFRHEWLDNLEKALAGRKPDYLVVQHMEPDHSANIAAFMDAFPAATIVSSAKAFAMMGNFFGKQWEDRRIVVKEGDTLALGRHVLHFVAAPMVHWPEVVVTYDEADKVLFSADGFGKFGALDVEEDWDCEARRYYFGIVGKYGAQVQALLKKAAGLDIQTVCPLHGPVLRGDALANALAKYQIWSGYEAETDGVFVAYTSVYGHTKEAALRLVELLKARGCPKVGSADLARDDMAEAVEDAFRHGKLVLATTTYNAEIFPFMHTFIDHLVERNYQNRTIGLIENGSWAPLAAKIMRGRFEKSKNIRFTDTTVHIQSALSDASRAELEALADELCREYVARADAATPKNDPAALNNIGYGLYVVTTKDEKGKDNGLIVNTVAQVSDNPTRVAVTINKLNYSHHVVKQTGALNVNCLSEDAPFEIFQRYGFQSGRTADKFAGVEGLSRTSNGLAVLPRHVCAVLSLKVEQYVDMGSHGMFVCSVAESRVLSSAPAMTYAYYHANVKPKPQPAGGRKGWVCKICGYVHEGDTLPDDFICPLCKHGAADFEPLA